MTSQIIINERRRAEIDGNTVRLFVNRGIKHAAWREFWHMQTEHARRIANAWVLRSRLPRTI